MADLSKASPGPWQASGVRTHLGGEPVLQLVDAKNRAFAYVLYGNGSTQDHLSAHADAAILAHAWTLQSEVVPAFKRLLDTARSLVQEIYDPGTEALAAIYCAERLMEKIDG